MIRQVRLNWLLDTALNFAKSIASAAQATGLISASVSVGVQILLGGSLVLFWSLVNTI